jgi:hypothetical protein
MKNQGIFVAFVRHQHVVTFIRLVVLPFSQDPSIPALLFGPELNPPRSRVDAS